MKNKIAGTLTVLFVSILFFAGYKLGFKSGLDNAPPGETVIVAGKPLPPYDDTADREFVAEMMFRCRADLSPGKTEILRNQIARIARKRIEGRDAQQAFVYILCIESRYNQAAKSSVGAVGIAQVMPKYTADFAKDCGLGEIKPEDALDTEMNLTLGACFFNKLVKETGNVYLASAAYNAGASSNSVKNLKALSAGAPETMAYVAKIAILKEENAKKEK